MKHEYMGVVISLTNQYSETLYARLVELFISVQLHQLYQKPEKKKQSVNRIEFCISSQRDIKMRHFRFELNYLKTSIPLSGFKNANAAIPKKLTELRIFSKIIEIN